MERQINTKTVYEGHIVALKVDDVELRDGKLTKREVVMHSGGACIAVKTPRDTYYLVRQYRYAQGTEMIEFCAGKLEKGEDHRETVIREAREELGVEVKDVKYHGYMVPTCGYSNEKIYLYSATATDYLGQDLDEDEHLSTIELSLDEIQTMIADGRITDGKTICLVYHLVNGGRDAQNT